MTDRPIIFSAPMVKALLAGEKTQTRRSANPQPVHDGNGWWRWASGAWSDRLPGPILVPGHSMARAARYSVGDRLYVRENHYLTDEGDFEIAVYAADEEAVAKHKAEIEALAEAHKLDAAWKARHLKLRPSIHMPRWASRLTLTVTEVRVQRLRDITEEDAKAEGATQVGIETGQITAQSTPIEIGSYTAGFAELWDSINGAGAWDANPWVVAVSFTVEKANIDALTP